MPACVSMKARFRLQYGSALSNHGRFTARPEALRNYLIPPAKFRDSVLNLDKTISCHTISNELLIITQKSDASQNDSLAVSSNKL